MGDLQKEVKGLTGGRVLTVGVFQRVSPMFLNIEAFILDLPTQPTSWIGQGSDILRCHREVAQPFEAGGAGLAVYRACFETFNDGQGMRLALGGDVAVVIGPALLL